MRLAWTAITPASISECADLWADRRLYRDGELAAALDAATALLRQRRAIGALISGDGRPIGYGVSAFVEQAFVDDYLAAPHPQIRKRLLLGESGGPSNSILDPRRIGEANARDGLHLVVLGCNYIAHSSFADWSSASSCSRFRTSTAATASREL
jgi:hypothetical protein